LRSTPGTAYSYSNWGFALLGTLMADRYAPSDAGVPNFAKLVGDLVTGPLGMRNTVLEPIPPTPAMAQPTCGAGVATPCYWNNVNAYAFSTSGFAHPIILALAPKQPCGTQGS
jgi:D-alanyl-D-alanine-carboxypeptidase/D-alanyl-D-alanine-endopeptidase